MRFLFSGSDGGKNSGVTGYWLVEWKKGFSINLIKFEPNHRENYHSHAFNALTWWLKGTATEEFPNGEVKKWKPSFWPKFTPRSNIHRYKPKSTVWAFTVRGPWVDTWKEYNPITKKYLTLTKGRRVIHTT